MKIVITSNQQYDGIYDFVFCSTDIRQNIIMAASNSRDLSANMIRCRSSNVWSYKFNIATKKDKTGDLVVQFKNKNGGPGEVYMFFDVPRNVYNKLVTAPSKGHFLWQYIRSKYPYRHLTGNKRGILPNAIN